MEKVEEEGLASVTKVDRPLRKHPTSFQTAALAQHPSSAALPPSSPLAPPVASFLVPAGPTIFDPNVKMQCKSM